MTSLAVSVCLLLAVCHVAVAQNVVGLPPWLWNCDFKQDLRDFEGNSPAMDTVSVEWVQLPQKGVDDNLFTTWPCNMQGVIKIRVPANRNAVNITFNLYRPRNYTFHIADSSTNNGQGGDAGTSGGYNAEMYLFSNALNIYRRTVGRAANDPVPYMKLDYFIIDQQGFLQILITKDNFIKIKNHPRHSRNVMETQGDMFRTDEFELYVGLNRLVGDSTLYGDGNCGVCVLFS